MLKNTRSFRNVKFLSQKILDCISISKFCVEKYSIELNFAASHGSNSCSGNTRKQDQAISAELLELRGNKITLSLAQLLMQIILLHTFCWLLTDRLYGGRKSEKNLVKKCVPPRPNQIVKIQWEIHFCSAVFLKTKRSRIFLKKKLYKTLLKTKKICFWNWFWTWGSAPALKFCFHAFPGWGTS